MDRFQEMYNAIIVRGRRNNPTYAEVRRENIEQLITRIDPAYGVRI